MSILGRARCGLSLDEGHTVSEIQLGTRDKVAELFGFHNLLFRHHIRDVWTRVAVISQGHWNVGLWMARLAEGEDEVHAVGEERIGRDSKRWTGKFLCIL